MKIEHITRPLKITHSANDNTTKLLLVKRGRQRAAPSRHCMATVTTERNELLTNSQEFISALESILEKEQVTCLGYVNHDFDNKSFTTVVGLAESHISVHTWPERSAVQLDVFLCNYIHDNTAKCQRIFDAITEYFDPQKVDATYLERF